MKKFLSIILAGIMLMCMIPTVAFAEDATNGIFVGTTQYSSIDAAAAAAATTDSMVAYANTHCSDTVKSDFVSLLTAAYDVASESDKPTIQGWINTLSGQQGGGE